MNWTAGGFLFPIDAGNSILTPVLPGRIPRHIQPASLRHSHFLELTTKLPANWYLL